LIPGHPLRPRGLGHLPRKVVAGEESWVGGHAFVFVACAPIGASLHFPRRRGKTFYLGISRARLRLLERKLRVVPVETSIPGIDEDRRSFQVAAQPLCFCAARAAVLDLRKGDGNGVALL